MAESVAHWIIEFSSMVVMVVLDSSVALGVLPCFPALTVPLLDLALSSIFHSITSVVSDSSLSFERSALLRCSI